MKRFKAEIKATTDTGMDLKYTVNSLKGLLAEAAGMYAAENGNEAVLEVVNSVLANTAG